MSAPVHTGEGQKVTKKFLSEHTDGLVVDLSLCFLQEIPVNELVSYDKGLIVYYQLLLL